MNFCENGEHTTHIYTWGSSSIAYIFAKKKYQVSTIIIYGIGTRISQNFIISVYCDTCNLSSKMISSVCLLHKKWQAQRIASWASLNITFYELP